MRQILQFDLLDLTEAEIKLLGEHVGNILDDLLEDGNIFHALVYEDKLGEFVKLLYQNHIDYDGFYIHIQNRNLGELRELLKTIDDAFCMFLDREETEASKLKQIDAHNGWDLK